MRELIEKLGYEAERDRHSVNRDRVPVNRDRRRITHSFVLYFLLFVHYYLRFAERFLATPACLSPTATACFIARFFPFFRAVFLKVLPLVNSRMFRPTFFFPLSPGTFAPFSQICGPLWSDCNVHCASQPALIHPQRNSKTPFRMKEGVNEPDEG